MYSNHTEVKPFLVQNNFTVKPTHFGLLTKNPHTIWYATITHNMSNNIKDNQSYT